MSVHYTCDGCDVDVNNDPAYDSRQFVEATVKDRNGFTKIKHYCFKCAERFKLW